MNSNIASPPEMHEHPDLLHEINKTKIAIRVWYIQPGEGVTQQAIDELQAHNPRPTWEQINDLLGRCRDAIAQQKKKMDKKY